MATKLAHSELIEGLQGRRVADFWAWAYSDLLSNTVRPIFAQYLVAECLGLVGQPRVEWNYVDFRYRHRNIEVKSAGYVQTWQQRAPSTITFDIASKCQPWNAATNSFLPAGRSADLYVFCLHTDCVREACVVHDTGRWEFYVLTCKAVGETFGDQKSVRLTRIRAATTATSFSNLRATIDAVIDNMESYTQSASSAKAP
jgi:hypothetical protein